MIGIAQNVSKGKKSLTKHRFEFAPLSDIGLSLL